MALITDTIVESQFVSTEVSTRTFSVEPLSGISILSTSGPTAIEPGAFSINSVNYLDSGVVTLITETNQTNAGNDTYSGGLINFTYVASPVLITETTQVGGQLNFYIVRPLGQELIREYWI
jgi:hypothetical protein